MHEMIWKIAVLPSRIPFPRDGMVFQILSGTNTGAGWNVVRDAGLRDPALRDTGWYVIQYESNIDQISIHYMYRTTSKAVMLCLLVNYHWFVVYNLRIHHVRTLYVQHSTHFFCNLSIESQLYAINYKLSYQESKNLQTSAITSLFADDIVITLIEGQPKKKKSSRLAGCGMETGSRGTKFWWHCGHWCHFYFRKIRTHSSISIINCKLICLDIIFVHKTIRMLTAIISSTWWLHCLTIGFHW